jgi:hypothetical protein
MKRGNNSTDLSGLSQYRERIKWKLKRARLIHHFKHFGGSPGISTVSCGAALVAVAGVVAKDATGRALLDERG